MLFFHITLALAWEREGKGEGESQRESQRGFLFTQRGIKGDFESPIVNS
jgi:hypothetical protein